VLAAEHALELELLDLAAHRIDIARYFDRGALVLVGLGHLQQVSRVGQPAVEPLELPHDAIELGAFAAQRFGARGVLPDLGIFQPLLDLRQPFLLAIEVKDTPEARPTARGAGE
jgi:hypothetical protein